MTDWNQKICYLCERKGADSKDHVPPRGTLPPEYTGEGEDLMTVPAHQDCNGRLSLDDYFQIQIALASALHPGETRDALLKRTTKGLERPQAEALVQLINSEFIDEEVVVDGLYRPELISKTANWERMLAIVERTARGIHYYVTRDVLPLDWPVEPQFSSLLKARQLWNSIPANEIRSFARNSFQYCWKRRDRDPRCGVMIFLFHEAVFFKVNLGTSELCANTT